MKNLIISAINFYQKFISPFFPQSCRFYPTCSQYAKESIIKYGIIKGILKSIKRIFKCNPFHPGGIDKV